MFKRQHMVQRRLKTFILFVFAVAHTSVYGQTEFTITGYGPKMKNGDSLFLAYKENGKFILKSTTAKNKRFTFNGSITIPTKAYICRNVNPEYADFITESVDIFLEPGKISIKSKDTLTGAVVGGTKLNNTLQLFENQRYDLKQRRKAIKDPDFFTESEKKDTAMVNYSKREIEKMFYEDADNKLAFAKKYPDSYVSLDLLYSMSRINTYIFKVEEAYNTLSDDLKQTEQGTTIKERINKKRQLMPGMKAIDFDMQDTNGNIIRLSSFNEKYVLLDFWASWCGPCREEHPNLKEQYEKYKNKNFVILSISIDTNKDRWLNAITKDELTWTQVSDLKGDKGDVYLKYGITSIPANFLIAPNGTVIAKDLKGQLLEKELENLLSNNK